MIPNEIIKRIENGPEDEEVQLLVKMMYENRISSISDMAKSQFVRFESSSYISGDIARMHEKEYGKDGCRFIADAIVAMMRLKTKERVDKNAKSFK